MDSLIVNHSAHRSSSDRLLNNYLDSQKHLTTSLLSLLSHSHTSTSSLLAYTTSSPGVLLSIRRAVRHAAFEGPVSSTHDHTANGSMVESNSPGWAAYVSSLEDFRRDLKQIHLLEEEVTRVKRDREILVTRLIKTTKQRPTKSDIKGMLDTMARDSTVMSSQASVFSDNSNTSAGGRESKRAGKMAEAQAELLGCEEHLRSLEVRIEHERNKVMYRGLEERFRAMEAVGHMWITQARRGLADLDKLPELPHGAYEMESNGSIAPSQSASQVGYEEAPTSSVTQSRRPANRQMLGMRVPDSLNGSIAEEDEGGSSDDEPQGTLVMHTNKPTPTVKTNSIMNGAAKKSSPNGAAYSPQEVARQTSPRRATSDIGALAPYNSTRSPLRRTVSSNRIHERSNEEMSETSSTHTIRKSGGFFSSIARFFKGPKRQHGHGRSGRVSPVKGHWQTRTDTNVKRASTIGRRRGDDSSSDEDDNVNLVSVSNIGRDFGGWNVADVGRDRTSSRPGVKRSASTKSKSTVVSQSTVVARRPFSPSLPPSTSLSSVSRSNTMKSSKSATTISTKTNGSTIPRSKSARSAKAKPNNPMLAAAEPLPPTMPDVPKAPKSGLNPHLELAKAPGTSIIPREPNTTSQMMTIASLPRRYDDELRPSDSISRSNSTRTNKSTKSVKAEGKRRSAAPRAEDLLPSPVAEEPPRNAVSPLPPSKMRSPPLKSAMRPTSPSPLSLAPAPVITTLYNISAPGPVELPPDPEPEPEPIATRPEVRSRQSFNSGRSGGDETSIYESAAEDANDVPDDESDDDDVTELGNFTVVDNDQRGAAPRLDVQRDSPMVLDTPSASNAGPDGFLPPIPTVSPVVLDDGGGRVVRRKSVRMNLPDDATPTGVEDERERERARERAFADAAVAAHSPPRAPPPRDDSPPPARSQAVWDTRIGRVRDDSSDEENPMTDEYSKARRGLIRNSGNFDDVLPKKKKKKAGGSGSVKSKGSVKGRAR